LPAIAGRYILLVSILLVRENATAKKWKLQKHCYFYDTLYDNNNNADDDDDDDKILIRQNWNSNATATAPSGERNCSTAIVGRSLPTMVLLMSTGDD